MDILYILGNGSRWRNNEIRYSLRSLQKHAQNVERVFITGEKPDFINDNIKYNYYPDKYICNINHLLKVLYTFQTTDISDDILLNYDDNFFIKDIDINKYPFYYNRQEIPESFDLSNTYTKSKIFTRNILLNLGKPIKDFGVHCPVIYNRQKFYEFENKFKQYNELNPRNVGISVRNAYLNNLEIEGEYLPDVKINRILTKRDIELKIEGRNVFSIGNNIISGGIVEFLEENYPNKSRWER